MAPTKRPRNNAAVGAGFLLRVNDCMVWSFIGCQLLSKVIDSEWSLTASNIIPLTSFTAVGGWTLVGLVIDMLNMCVDCNSHEW